MFVYNRQYPTGIQTGVDILANGRAFPDRMATFNAEQEQFVLNRRQLVENHERELLRNASTLPRDIWGEWDREAVQIQRDVLAVYGDLAAAVGMPMPIGKLVHFFQQVSDSGSVNVSMDGRSKGRTDQPYLTWHGTPLPIIDSPFSYGWRMMETARTEGYQLDAAGRRNAMRKVAEKLEQIALVGDSSIVVGGDQLYGITNHPMRNTRSTGNDLSSCTGAQWIAEVTATLALLHADNFRVPATIYVNWDDWYYASNTDLSDYKGKTIAQRVLEIMGVKEVIPASDVAADTLIAVVKDRSTVRVLNGMPMNTRQQFRANPEDDYNFVTMAAAAVEILYDAEGQCGIAHSS